MLKSFQFSWLFIIIIIITSHFPLYQAKKSGSFHIKKQKNQTNIIQKTKKMQNMFPQQFLGSQGSMLHQKQARIFVGEIPLSFS